MIVRVRACLCVCVCVRVRVCVCDYLSPSLPLPPSLSLSLSLPLSFSSYRGAHLGLQVGVRGQRVDARHFHAQAARQVGADRVQPRHGLLHLGGGLRLQQLAHRQHLGELVGAHAAELIFRQMQKMGVKRIGFLSSNTGFGKAGKELPEAEGYYKK
mgnify:CR=1 FL=1